eukprot:31344-Pelagococcus_subviridis.AAC.1
MPQRRRRAFRASRRTARGPRSATRSRRGGAERAERGMTLSTESGRRRLARPGGWAAAVRVAQVEPGPPRGGRRGRGPGVAGRGASAGGRRRRQRAAAPVDSRAERAPGVDRVVGVVPHARRGAAAVRRRDCRGAAELVRVQRDYCSRGIWDRREALGLARRCSVALPE